MKFECYGMQCKIEECGKDVLTDCVGDMCYCDETGNYKIRLLQTLNTIEKKRVLRHELCHFIIRHTAINIRHKYDTEELCEFVAIFSPRINEIANEYFAQKDKDLLRKYERMAFDAMMGKKVEYPKNPLKKKEKK